MRPLLLALALSLFAPVAHAGDRMDEIADELGLDATQRAAVEEIVYSSQRARVDARAKLKRAELDLKHALGAATLDEKAVRTATDAVAAATAELVRNKVDRIVAIRKQLTPAQWEELKQLWLDDDRRGRRDDDRDEDDDE